MVAFVKIASNQFMENKCISETAGYHWNLDSSPSAKIKRTLLLDNKT